MSTYTWEFGAEGSGLHFTIVYDDAEQIAKETVSANPDYAWVRPHFQALVEKYSKTPMEMPSFQAYAAWEREGQRGDPRHGHGAVHGDGGTPARTCRRDR